MVRIKIQTREMICVSVFDVPWIEFIMANVLAARLDWDRAYCSIKNNFWHPFDAAKFLLSHVWNPTPHTEICACDNWTMKNQCDGWKRSLK